MGVLGASRYRPVIVLEAVLWMLNTGAQRHLLPQKLSELALGVTAWTGSSPDFSPLRTRST
jgi:hypothetical protein